MSPSRRRTVRPVLDLQPQFRRGVERALLGVVGVLIGVQAAPPGPEPAGTIGAFHPQVFAGAQAAVVAHREVVGQIEAGGRASAGGGFQPAVVGGGALQPLAVAQVLQAHLAVAAGLVGIGLRVAASAQAKACTG